MENEVTYTVRDYWAADYPHVADIWERTGISTPGRGDSAEMIENTLRHKGRLAQTLIVLVFGTAQAGDM